MRRKLLCILLALAMVLTMMPETAAVSFAAITPQLPEGFYIRDAQDQDVLCGDGWEYDPDTTDNIIITKNDLYISGSAEKVIYIDGNVTTVNVGNLECAALGSKEGSGVCEFKLASSVVSVDGFGSTNRDIKISGKAPTLNLRSAAECGGNVEIAVDNQLTVTGIFGVFGNLTVSRGNVSFEGFTEEIPSPLLVVGDINADGYEVLVAETEGEWTIPNDKFGIYQPEGSDEFKYYTTDGTTAAKYVKFEKNDAFIVQRMNGSGELEAVEPGPDTWEEKGGWIEIHENDLYLKGSYDGEVYIDYEISRINLCGFRGQYFYLSDEAASDSVFTINSLSKNNIIHTIDGGEKANIKITGSGALKVTSTIRSEHDFEIDTDDDFVLNYINDTGAYPFVIGGRLIVTKGSIDAELTNEPSDEAPATPLFAGGYIVDGCDIFMAADGGSLTENCGDTKSIEVGRQTLYYFVLDDGKTVASHIKISKSGERKQDISTGEISGLNEYYAYTGEEIAPEITVKYDGKVLTPKEDYAVRYENNIDIGIAKVIVSGKGTYTGKITAEFEIMTEDMYKKLAKLQAEIDKLKEENTFSEEWSYDATKHWHVCTYPGSIKVNDFGPHDFNDGTISKGVKTYICKICGCPKKVTLKVSVPKTSITSVKRAKKAFTVKWAKKKVTGYEIQYATNSKFTKGKKVVKVTKAGTVSKKISKLKAKKRYYVRVRGYINKYGKTYYSGWSAKKSVMTK